MLLMEIEVHGPATNSKTRRSIYEPKIAIESLTSKKYSPPESRCNLLTDHAIDGENLVFPNRAEIFSLRCNCVHPRVQLSPVSTNNTCY